VNWLEIAKLMPPVRIHGHLDVGTLLRNFRPPCMGLKDYRRLLKHYPCYRTSNSKIKFYRVCIETIVISHGSGTKMVTAFSRSFPLN